ncbi:MAG: CARDB domain-containing protein [Bacteroidota bacterium]
MRLLFPLLLLLCSTYTLAQNWQQLGYPIGQITAVNKSGNQIEYGTSNQHFFSTDNGNSWQAQLSSANLPEFSSFNNQLSSAGFQFGSLSSFLFDEVDLYYVSLNAYYRSSKLYTSSLANPGPRSINSGFVYQKSSYNIRDVKRLSPTNFVMNYRGSIDYFGTYNEVYISNDAGDSFRKMSSYRDAPERFMEALTVRGNTAILYNPEFVYYKSLPDAVELDSFPLPAVTVGKAGKWLFNDTGQEIYGIFVNRDDDIIYRFISTDEARSWQLEDSADWTLMPDRADRFMGLFGQHLFIQQFNSEQIYRVPILDFSVLPTLAAIDFSTLNPQPDLRESTMTENSDGSIALLSPLTMLKPIYVSEDEGASWQIMPRLEFSTATMHQLGNAWYTYFRGMVVRTTDGKTFTLADPDPQYFKLAYIVDNGSIFVLDGGGKTLYRSTDGINWTVLPSPPISQNQSYSVAIANGLIIASRGTEAYRSTDFGATWLPFNGTPPTNKLKYEPESGRWYHITTDNTNQRYIYNYSTDQGASWQELTLADPATWVTPFSYTYDYVVRGNAFLLRTQANIYLSENGGQQWQTLNNLPFAEGSSGLDLMGDMLRVSTLNEGLWELPFSELLGNTPSTDLELSATTSNSDPGLWQALEIDYVLKNTGNAEASDVVVQLDDLPADFVFSGGQEATTSQGSFIPYGAVIQWNVGTVRAGEEAHLTIRLFNKTMNSKIVFAQVQSAVGNEEDSTPGNGTCCTALEDDEAAVEFNGTTGTPLLEIVRVDCPAAYPGPNTPITWTVEVANNGTGTSTVQNWYLFNGAFVVGPRPTVEYGAVVVPALAPGQRTSLTFNVDPTTYFPTRGDYGQGEQDIFTGRKYLSLSMDGSTNDFPDASNLFDPYCQKFSTDLELELELISAPNSTSDPLTFRMVVTNNGPVKAYNVRTTFDQGAIPSGFSLPTINAIVSEGQAWTGNLSGGGSTPFNEYWSLPELAAGESATAEVSITPPSGLPWPSTIELRRRVSSGHNNDLSPTNNEATLQIPVGNNDEPDLQLSGLQVGATAVPQGQILDFNFDLTNIGTGDASGTFNIRSWLSTDPQLSGDDVQDGLIPTGNLEAGASVAQVIGALTVPADLPTGDYYLILVVDADQEIDESNENNNSLVSSNTISITASGSAKLELVAVGCPDNFPSPNQPLTWDFTLQNTGTLASVEQEIYLHNSIFFGPAFFNTLYGSTTIPALAPGASANLSIAVPASKYFPQPGQANRGEQFLFTGNVYLSLSADGFTQDFASSSTGFNPYCQTTSTDLEIDLELLSPANNLLPADSVTYRVTVRNNGPEKAYNAIADLSTGIQAGFVPPIRTVLSKGEQWLQTPGLGSGGGIYDYFWYLPELEIGEEATAEVTIYPYSLQPLTAPFTIINEVSSGHNTDAKASNDLAELEIGRLSGGPDLEISLEALPNAQPSQYTTFQLRLSLSNTGTSTAENVRVTLPKPDGVVYSGGNEFTTTQGTYNVYSTQEWVVGTVPAGQTAILDVNFFVLSVGPVSFFAEVSAQDGGDSDSTPGNGNGIQPTEDDEAALTINESTANRQGAGLASSARASLFEVQVVRLFPNPAVNELQLGIEAQTEFQHYRLQIYDLSGQVMISRTVHLRKGYNQLRLAIDALPAGMYSIVPETSHQHRPLYFLKARL